MWPERGFESNRLNAAKILHFHVEKIVLHPANEIGLSQYDIALMKVRGRIPYIWNKSVAASLPLSNRVRQWSLGGQKCAIVGWGCTRAGDAVADVASVANLKTLRGRTCDQFFNDVNHGHEFCAGYYKSGLGTCSGDSGSGLVCKHLGSTMVIGVASRSHTEEPQNYPGIYVRVATVLNWIQTEMKQD
ncbi:hypothetical protein PHET_04229 [Paragonimus heterotremus]|uniref:Peptidase S1 domain-containing protein n=1 Tax=Paragonimus heterotremus TaxID=100268 RepID=A0A8J4WJ94_9TREM|nr:hypothetical protein PHET_04229 [Paragonimus heterotremus]